MRGLGSVRIYYSTGILKITTHISMIIKCPLPVLRLCTCKPVCLCEQLNALPTQLAITAVNLFISHSCHCTPQIFYNPCGNLAAEQVHFFFTIHPWYKIIFRQNKSYKESMIAISQPFYRDLKIFLPHPLRYKQNSVWNIITSQ